MLMNPQPYKTDVAVLILFFNRPDHLRRVFDEVRKARPSKLFLYQDGPRGERDMPGIEACRRVVEDIDWQCEVHRKYQERNFGCDPSEYISQKWAFSIVDRCIVLEDDDVPSQSFFPFCKEMLDRYADDERVWMIAGFNPEEQVNSPYDYLFTSVFSIWGWASWRRVINTWDPTYACLDDPDAKRQLDAVMRQRRYCLDTLRACYDHRASGKEYYETIFWTSMVMNSGLADAQYDKQSRSHRRFHPLYGFAADHAAPPPPTLHHESLRAGRPRPPSALRHRGRRLQGAGLSHLRLRSSAHQGRTLNGGAVAQHPLPQLRLHLQGCVAKNKENLRSRPPLVINSFYET